MIDPLFWLGFSLLLVAVSLTAVLVAAMPALQELARAARSAEKLFDTLSRELPPTLEAIRLTGLEITDLTDDVSDGVKSAAQVAKQVDQSLDTAVKQAQKIEVSTRSVYAGMKAAWRTLLRPAPNRRYQARQNAQRDRLRSSDRAANAAPSTPLEQYRSYHQPPDRTSDLDAANWHQQPEDDLDDYLP